MRFVHWIMSFFKPNKEEMTVDDKVLAVAKQLIADNVGTTTLDVKLELRKQYPNEQWTQGMVSTIMQALEAKGEFTSTDSGQGYRNYFSGTLAPKATPQPGLGMTHFKVTTIQLTADGYQATINKQKAYEMITNTKGRFFTAKFIDKDGNERVMNAQYMKQPVNPLGYVKVYDIALRKKDPNNCIRQINMQTLKSLSFKDKEFIVK